MSQPKKKKSPTSTPSSPAPKPAPVAATETGHKHNWVWPSVLSVAAMVVIILAFSGIAYATQTTGLARGLKIAGVKVGGLKSSAGLLKVEQAWNTYLASPLTFNLNTETIKLDIVSAATTEDGGLTKLVGFDPVAAVNSAAAFGHQGTFWRQLRERISAFIGRPHDFGTVVVETDMIEQSLREKTEKLTTTAVDAAITIDEAGAATVTSEKSGQLADVKAAASRARRQAISLDLSPIVISMKLVEPAYAKNTTTVALATSDTAAVIARAPLTLKLSAKTWTIDAAQLKKLLGFRTNASHEIKVGFDRAKTAAYLESLRAEIDVKPAEARFEMVNGRVQAFSSSQVGVSLDTAATLQRLNEALDKPADAVNVAVTEIKPQSESLAATNNLGITELVAEASTNFAGSPTNRRYNLTLGAQRLNGLLIKPNESFSLIKALGEIDAAHGWRSELVIKPGGIIKPEYGGGLCQVATTAFRVALNAGLPIVERRNHSLRISYYEPPIGLDATIYEPSPDLKFTNDYAHALLLQTEVVGNNITFRFYGTKDGRTIDLPTPKVYNRTGIPATKTIEVTDLKPGVKVCQTPGHPGADATATYTVTKADGAKKTQVFQSHYMAIGVICRVGKAATKPKTTTNTNKSTNTNKPTNTNSTNTNQ